VSAVARPRGAALVVRDERARALELGALAREAGVHPELVRRLVTLGLLDDVPDEYADRRQFRRDAALRIDRAVRLRNDLGLNFAGALLACELLDRIELLERRLRRNEHPERRWRVT
jgi:DNA-binding transcriptional MerR regulator